MTDSQRAADKLVEYLKMCGSSDEADISMDRTERGDDHYKPLYRTISLFTAPTLPYLKDVLGGETPSMTQAAEIMRLADPYFIRALEEEWDTFESLWESHVDAWAPWGDEEADG